MLKMILNVSNGYMFIHVNTENKSWKSILQADICIYLWSEEEGIGLIGNVVKGDFSFISNVIFIFTWWVYLAIFMQLKIIKTIYLSFLRESHLMGRLRITKIINILKSKAKKVKGCYL